MFNTPVAQRIFVSGKDTICTPNFVHFNDVDMDLLTNKLIQKY